ncbi:MAG: Sir2 silent information regulator family NAD-dependent deacetylase [Clostridia bacterium]|nr:Sir2 silent information regulator family NAD-dependent deacetylase [Clostridia bacterium]
MTNTNDYCKKIEKIRTAINSADAVIIGAGAGLSTSAGYTYSGERFNKYFSDFKEKYGFTDMYSGGFYPYKTPEEKWAFWARYVFINRYTPPKFPVYDDLLNLFKDKNYFVITTNVDHCFQRAGFDKSRLFYTQGDYGLFQCSLPCHHKTYDNEEVVRKMFSEQKDGKIPSALIPYCPVCGREMSMNLRADDTFVEDEGWHLAAERYADFLSKYERKKVVFFELGVGGNTPVIIKYPFWRKTYDNANATYVCINLNDAVCPEIIKKRSILIDGDIGKAIKDILSPEINEDL